MYRAKSDKDKILHRLKIVRGHVDKIIRMVEDDDYCIDVLHQSDAVQKALHSADTAVLEYHLTHCTTKAFTEGNSAAAIDEILQVIRRR